MFISKREFKEAIQKAVREAEDKCWRAFEEERKCRYSDERNDGIERRLRKVEEKCGLVEPVTMCPCGMVVSKPKII